MQEMEKEKKETGEHSVRIFHGIRILFTPSTVHVDNGQPLKDYMGFQLKQARKLATYIKKEFKKEYGYNLRISVVSLTVELMGHFVLQQISLLVLKISRFFPMKRFIDAVCEWLLRHMEVIDCGGMKDDNNRLLWDLISLPLELKEKVRK